ncbi:hypothetical protein TruAng_002225 [Truncatella angustata]|nr:hypothetical protein TruAng_002225 [Truncatella angustata]
MSTAEEQELLAQINRLESRIHRHKNQHSQPPAYSRGIYRTAPYSRGYRGARSHAPTYRNKTLVLNGQARPDATATHTDANSSGAAWVSRTDRHLQLINSSVFEKDSQARASAMEETQRLKHLKKEQMEKNRFLHYVRQNASSIPSAVAAPNAAASKYEITVEGIRFQITKQGSKLVRAPDNPSSATPRLATIGGVRFYRTKNGNLVRHGIAKAQRMAGGIKKVNVPCKTFSWTDRQSATFWRGSCLKGPNCRFIHDPSKVAICRDWLFKSDCPNGDACDLSHETTEERTPLCVHFANGKLCRDFGLSGYCERGAKCPDRHVFECPDFSNSGACKNKGCKLLHRERASVLRHRATTAGDNDEDMPDLSSDDEGDGPAPDDIDSDEMEEFIGHDDQVDELDFSKDYIGF